MGVATEIENQFPPLEMSPDENEKEEEENEREPQHLSSLAFHRENHEPIMKMTALRASFRIITGPSIPQFRFPVALHVRCPCFPGRGLRGISGKRRFLQSLSRWKI